MNGDLAGPRSRLAFMRAARFATALAFFAFGTRAEAGDVGDIRPPVLVQFVGADYPDDARGAGVGGVVVLELAIDAEGRVIRADVKGSAGYGFDEVARAAALRFRFEPARRGAVAIAARILYRYEFHLPEPADEKNDADLARASRDAATTTESSDRLADAQAAPPAVDIPAPVPPGAPVNVTIRGPSAADRRRQSAEAVTVIELDQTRRGAADMGDVLARAPGVGVRRNGGLGSSTRFSLNGLTDDQVRFFLDGVPLELAGYPFGIANVPVNLVDRVEIYGGVVPVRFGADALGGAVNLVTARDRPGGRAAASYEVGSLDTHRVAFTGAWRDERTGWLGRLNAFFDCSRNDYPIDVDVPDDRGRLVSARTYRFHDAYRAAGASAEAGMIGRSWAKQLIVRIHATDYDKDYQHNRVMTVPYGGVAYGETSAGASIRYEQPLGQGFTVDGTAGYARAQGRFLDVATCVYDWFGRCNRERAQPGEIDGRPHDRVHVDHSGFARLHLRANLAPLHTLGLSLAPTYLTRKGDERRQSDPSTRDPLTARRELFTLVSGLEYKIDLFDHRLENIVFIKEYAQRVSAEEPLPSNGDRSRQRGVHQWGAGNGLRYRLTPFLYAKASYEWATRLPRADEIFGDNTFIVANLELRPETSHNANLGLTLDTGMTSAGAFRATVNGFVRDTDQLIVLLGSEQVTSYQNVLRARALGAETAVGWTAPGDYLAVEGNFTHLDFRNSAREGTFREFVGDRIPNRPYLFANGAVRAKLRGVVVAGDEVIVTWSTHYVHAFLRAWESIGLSEFKQRIPSQVVHAVGAGYRVQSDGRSLSITLDVQNVADGAAFDFFGVQRPGRAFYVKTTAEF
ncbi:MAG TPA: TonB-dependent siderophore myxochelin receptor MxcH [Polyangiaceae bacterium]|nr:TonB-dependent siderophore myxochelin receptor MxcH [Polyangiaceae bacterium]